MVGWNRLVFGIEGRPESFSEAHIEIPLRGMLFFFRQGFAQ